MLNLSRTLMHQCREIGFVPGFQVKEEGTPLVSMLVNGKEAVKSFEGAADLSAGARFAGFSYTETLTPVTANHAFVGVTDADGNVYLPYEPISGQVSAWTVDKKLGTRTRVAAADMAIDANNPHLLKLTGVVSAAVEVVYKYMPTLQTAFYEHRVLIPSVSASAMTNSTGVIIQGEVWTDKIDVAANFDNVALKLFISADGVISAAASVPATGLALNATVIGTPNGTNGFLGIRF